MHLLKFGRVINLETANGSDAHSQAKMAAPCEILEKCFPTIDTEVSQYVTGNDINCVSNAYSNMYSI